MRVGVCQNEVLHHKFDIDDTAAGLLEVSLAAEMGRHAQTHLHHRPLELGQVSRLADEIPAHRFEPRRERRISGNGARPHQRLKLPHPGLLLLVGHKRLEAGDHRAGIAGGPEAHVDLVEHAVVGARREHVQQPTRQPVQKLRALIGEAVDEHEIEI